MTIQDYMYKAGDFIREKKEILIGLTLIFIWLAYNGKIPTTFSVRTLSIFGSALTSFSLGAFMLALGIILLLIPEPISSFVLAPIFIIGAFAIGIGGALSVLGQLVQTLPGIIIGGVIVLFLFVRFAK